MRHSRQRHPGFSLIELVLVIVILGTIGAIAVPRLSRANRNASEAAFRSNLSVMTRAVEYYRAEHGGQPPVTSAQLTMYTSAAGARSATPSLAYPFGPYLHKIPTLGVGTNRDKSGITTVGAPGTDNTAGWWIDSVTGEVRANAPDADTMDDGTPVNEVKVGLMAAGN